MAAGLWLAVGCGVSIMVEVYLTNLTRERAREHSPSAINLHNVNIELQQLLPSPLTPHITPLTLRPSYFNSSITLTPHPSHHTPHISFLDPPTSVVSYSSITLTPHPSPSPLTLTLTLTPSPSPLTPLPHPHPSPLTPLPHPHPLTPLHLPPPPVAAAGALPLAASTAR